MIDDLFDDTPRGRAADAHASADIAEARLAADARRRWVLLYLMVGQELRRLYPYASSDRARVLLYQGLGWEIAGRLGDSRGADAPLQRALIA